MADRRILLCAAGLAAAVVLTGPIEAASGRRLALHMLQHVVLLDVTAPLLVLGVRRPRARAGGAGAVGAAVVASAVAMWLWHVPAMYDAAGTNVPLHVAEHATYVVSGALLWWAVGLGDARGPSGASVLGVFVSSLAGVALGAAMLFAPAPWYRDYPTLSDQQLAGVVMWSGDGLVRIVLGGLLFAGWVRHGAPGPANRSLGKVAA